MKWSDPSLIGLTSAQGLRLCEGGSSPETPGCEAGVDYGIQPGCGPGSTYGIEPGTPCSPVGNLATGDCNAGVDAQQPSSF